MEDTLLDNKDGAPGAPVSFADIAAALGKLLEEHKGADVTVLDLRDLNAWTDFFVIATASSSAHLQGLERHVKEFSREKGAEILRRSRKPPDGDDEWSLIDFGPVVVHLMSGKARSFYELERLWNAPVIYSSKSS
ncbi:MAG: ribosome silencing factor [Treponema sp.]|jgi:ribosome-associated protein|nr:ribosome silencing factor [Treponema sp.]